MNIDSDKLLALLDFHENRICEIDTRIIRDAIQSGELDAKDGVYIDNSDKWERVAKPEGER